MAREKGRGNLQFERGGRWTIRIGMCGRRFSRSSGTGDRKKAEALLERCLSAFGLGAKPLPLAEAWRKYEMSPERRDLARSTLDAKRAAWMRFARWTELNHPEATELSHVTRDVVAEYLAEYRARHSASTYNGHVCVLREIFSVLAGRAGLEENPWSGVRLRPGDSLSRRDLAVDEVVRLLSAAEKAGGEWRLLVLTGVYTGMRLGDCCRLAWQNVDLARGVIQFVPEKTKRACGGRMVTVPIHGSLAAALGEIPGEMRDGFVNPRMAELYDGCKWRLNEGLRRIFADARITMSVKMQGYARKCVVASFHSLRHTFVSLSANAGVPLPVVQSIVGHCSPAMTRHYYHESEEALRRAVAAIPEFGAAGG